MLSLAKYIMSRKQTHNFSNRNLIRTSFSSTLQRPSCDWEPQLTLVPSAYTGLATTSEELGGGQRDGELGRWGDGGLGGGESLGFREVDGAQEYSLGARGYSSSFVLKARFSVPQPRLLFSRSQPK